jgi:hypothetical protein
MNNSEFLAKVIQEKLQNDIDGNKFLKIKTLPIMKHPSKEQYNIPVIIDEDKIIVSIFSSIMDKNEQDLINISYIHESESYDDKIL